MAGLSEGFSKDCFKMRDATSVKSDKIVDGGGAGATKIRGQGAQQISKSGQARSGDYL